ncbi:MAG: thiamine phosphate synthase, partial [Thermomicrobiales bacterium]
MTPEHSSLRQQLLLYLVLDPDMVSGDLIAATQAALNAGVTMLQLRAKHHTDRAILEMATPVRRLCQAAAVPLIMNDRLDLAFACRADGIHLGVDDLPLPV